MSSLSSYGTIAQEPQWRRSSRCASRECVEVGTQDGMVLVRDSKDPSGGVLRYSFDEWRAFVVGVRAGEFDDLC
jgi:hypothetical protein